MTAITAATDTTGLTSLIPSEQISQIVRMPTGEGSPIHNVICDVVDGTTQRGSTYKFPIWNATDTAFSEASGKAEGDDAGFGAHVEQTMATAGSTSAVVVGMSKYITYEAMQDAGVELATLVQFSRIGLQKRITQDALLQVKTATNSSNYSGLALTKSRVGDAYTAFKTQVPETGMGRPMLVLHTDQMGDWRSSMEDSNASLLNESGHGADLFSPFEGFQGTYRGVPVFESPLVAAEDASNWSGGLFMGGQGGCLGLVNWLRPGVVPDVFDGGLMIKIKDMPELHGYYVICSVRYGTDLIQQGQMREIISQT